MTPSVPSKFDLFALVLGSLLVACNLVLQFLDWVTTFVGFSMGISEKNPGTLWLISKVGNEYLGISIEKIVYVSLFILSFFAIRVIVGSQRFFEKSLALILLYAVLLLVILVYVGTVAANFRAIGW